MNESNKTYIVSSGDEVVELEAFGLSETQAKNESDSLKSRGYRHVRIREEDPMRPTWPKYFDLSE